MRSYQIRSPEIVFFRLPDPESDSELTKPTHVTSNPVGDRK